MLFVTLGLKKFQEKCERERQEETTSSAAANNQYLELALPIILTAPNALICGDFNAHSALWDDHAASDERQLEVEDWLIENEHSVVNNNSPTRTNLGT